MHGGTLGLYFSFTFVCALTQKVVLPRLKAWIRRVAVEETCSVEEDKAGKSLAAETAEAVKAAASAAAIVATASQELLSSKKEGDAT